ncbi:MAG: DMT family transporter [Clostridiales bacterium]
MSKKQKTAIFFGILSAMLYGTSTPIAKVLLSEIPPTMLTALLYMGAGFGMLLLNICKKARGTTKRDKPLTAKDYPYIIGMVVLDIAAPIFLMIGLSHTTAANASLLNNFEIVSTSLIALFIFKEKVSKRLWLGIILVTAASIILTVDNICCLYFSYGSLLILLATICWGLENNCTKKLSLTDPIKIVIIKGFGSGFGALFIALTLGEYTDNLLFALIALAVGFVAYGLSIFFYIYAQRELGAAKTSTYYGIAPFIGVLFSLIIFREIPSISFIIALIFMIFGTYFTSTDHKKQKLS